MGNIKYLMVLAIAAVGMFAMPNLLATYAGTHTIEDNNPSKYAGASGKQIDCTGCHQYIFDSAGNTTSQNAGYNWNKHSAAASDTNYTTYLAYYGTNMNTSSPDGGTYAGYDLFFTAKAQKSDGKVKPGDILGHQIGLNGVDDAWKVVNNLGGGTNGSNATDVYGGKVWSACLVCHRAAYFYGGTHTRLQVRGCSNAWCHGNGAIGNKDAIGTNAGKKSYMADIPGFNNSKAAQTGTALNNSKDAHNNWFDRSAVINDTYQNALTGEFIKKDYYTCLGCHTHADVKLDITKETGFNVTLYNATTIGYAINYTNTTPLVGYKQGGAFKP